MQPNRYTTAVQCECNDWCTPLGIVGDFYYCLKRCHPTNGHFERTTLMRAKTWSALASKLAAAPAPNSAVATTSACSSDGAELLADFPLPIRFFQCPALCQRYGCFYTLGKDVVPSQQQAEQDQGQFLMAMQSSGSSSPNKEILTVIRIKYEPPVSIELFKSRGFFGTLWHSPTLYCEPGGTLYLCLNYLAQAKIDGFVNDHFDDFPDGCSPFIPIDLPPKTGELVHTTCIFRIILEEENDERNIGECNNTQQGVIGKLTLVHVPIPFPPIKETRIVRLNKKSDAVFSVADNLTLMPYHNVDADDDGAQLNLFTMNTDTRAHIFIAAQWHLCSMENEQTERLLKQGFTYTFDRHKLLASNGRIFLLLKSNRTNLVGPLFEVHISKTKKTFRLELLCEHTVLPKEISVACSLPNRLPGVAKFMAFSQLYQWHHFYRIHPKKDGDDTGCIQVLSIGEPYPLKEISFWTIQMLYWPDIFYGDMILNEMLKRDGPTTRSRKIKIDAITNRNKLEGQSIRRYVSDNFINTFLHSPEEERKWLCKSRQS